MNLLNLLSLEEKKYLKRFDLHTNQILFQEGDKCNEVFFIEKGKIEIISYSLEGNENIISSHKENQMFANALIFSNEPYFLGNVISKEHSIIYSLKKDDLIFILQNNILFLEQYIALISYKTISLTMKTKLLSHKSIRSRILFFLELNKGKYKKNITKIAKELILPRPSVSREIYHMEDESILEIKNGYILLK